MDIAKRELPMIRWASCPLCQGTGKIITGAGDNEGTGQIRPCPSLTCDNGVVKTVFVREE